VQQDAVEVQKRAATARAYGGDDVAGLLEIGGDVGQSGHGRSFRGGLGWVAMIARPGRATEAVGGPLLNCAA
jgi:hypothetical protein